MSPHIYCACFPVGMTMKYEEGTDCNCMLTCTITNSLALTVYLQYNCLKVWATSGRPINSIALARSCHVGGGLTLGSHFSVRTAMRHFCGSPRYISLIMLSWAWGIPRQVLIGCHLSATVWYSCSISSFSVGLEIPRNEKVIPRFKTSVHGEIVVCQPTKYITDFLKIDVLYLESEAGDWNMVMTVHRSADIHTKIEVWTAVEKVEESSLEA